MIDVTQYIKMIVNIKRIFIFIYIMSSILYLGQSTANNEDLRVDLDIEDEDYELQDNQTVTKVKTQNETLFNDFNNIAQNEYEKNMQPHRSSSERINHEEIESKREITKLQTPFQTSSMPSHFVGKRNIERDVINNMNLPHYSKEYLKEGFQTDNIYHAVKTGKFNAGFWGSLKDMMFLDFITANCTEEDLRGIGAKAIKCLITDLIGKKQSYKVVAIRLWNIAMLWGVVSLVIAVPLWCTRGWCSCCLWCKFFKPQETIQEAKKYLLLNPPGILVTKKGGIIHYEPTEREKDCYEEFGHFIRTL